eukprot:13089387-Alexandrium_andersonii.AAC.1
MIAPNLPRSIRPPREDSARAAVLRCSDPEAARAPSPQSSAVGVVGVEIGSEGPNYRWSGRD